MQKPNPTEPALILSRKIQLYTIEPASILYHFGGLLNRQNSTTVVVCQSSSLSSFLQRAFGDSDALLQLGSPYSFFHLLHL